MRPPVFFAIFIPILSIIVTTLFINFLQNRHLSTKMIKVLFTTVTGGVLVGIIIFIELIA